MAAEPLVCAVMLTRDRPQMAARAVRCFRKQTYPRKRLVIWNTSPVRGHFLGDKEGADQSVYHTFPDPGGSVGALRNRANSSTNFFAAEAIIHWDDDDYSHPNRIAEQVAQLQWSGGDCVRYDELLYWDKRGGPAVSFEKGHPGAPAGYLPGEVIRTGAAWLYRDSAAHGSVGASLCYWRSAWEKRHFEDVSIGEDVAWLKGVRSVGLSGMGEPSGTRIGICHEPRLIQSIHGDNTANRPDFAAIERSGNAQWRRVPEWDAYCAERMAL